MNDEAFRVVHFYDADTNEALGAPMEDTNLPVSIGDGLIWHDGDRFRVVDRWVSIEHHGHLNIGVHLWLRKAADDDDRPHATSPGYYTR